MDKPLRNQLLLFPLILIREVITWVLKITGRLVAAALGFVLLLVGLLVSLTVVGALVGIPLMVFGFLLMLRAIF